MNYKVPFSGKETAYVYVDFDESKVVKSIKDIDFCREVHWKKKMNLRDMIDRLKDPKGGLVKYLGERTCEWTDKKYYTFRLNIETKEIRKTELYYFNTENE